jgi:flagellar motor protein MotB
VRVVGDKIVLDDRVHFATNSATIRRISHPLLERVARLILENPTYVRIHIAGHVHSPFIGRKHTCTWTLSAAAATGTVVVVSTATPDAAGSDPVVVHRISEGL